VIAYKFLAAGAVGPFSGFRWPAPPPGAPGAWVEAPGHDLDRGVHGCRLEHLPYWFDEELWRVELADPVAERDLQVVSLRGRLVERVAGWDRAAAGRFAEASAWRARNLAADALRPLGLPALADALARAGDLPALRAAAAALAGSPGLPALLAGYLGDAVWLAGAGSAAGAAYVAARAAAAVAGDETAFDAERSTQARWLADELHL